VDRVHQAGARIIPGIYPFSPEPTIRQHPDWLYHAEDSDALDRQVKDVNLKNDGGAYSTNATYRAMCLLSSPWKDQYLQCLGEIVRDYHLDGLEFDGNYHPAICYCRYCKERYLKDTGRALPKVCDVNDPVYRLYQLWADERLEDWYRRLQEKIKGINPDAALCTWTINAGRYMHFVWPRGMSARMNLLEDVPQQEWWFDEAHVGGSVMGAFGAAYGWAVSSHRLFISQPYMMTRFTPYGTDSFPNLEIVARTLLAYTNGSLTATYMGWSGHRQKHVAGDRRDQETFPLADQSSAGALGGNARQRADKGELRPGQGGRALSPCAGGRLSRRHGGTPGSDHPGRLGCASGNSQKI